MKSYARYKDSGISWIGKIPEHWERIPFFMVMTPKSECGHSDEDLLSVYLDKGVVKYSDVAEKRTNATSDDKEKYQLVDIGDFVMNNQQAWRGSVGISFHKGIVSPAYIILGLSSKFYLKYANYLLRDQFMVSLYYLCSKGVGSIQRNLVWNKLRQMPVFIPPLEEQESIAAYLDKKTEQINELVAAKQKQIELLKEYKQSLIANAVTKGINPKVKMKDSGINWIGKVPEHWSIHFLFQKAKEHYISNKNIHHQNLLSLSYGRIIQKDINTTEGLLPESFDTYQIVEDGNIVLRLTDLQNDHKSLRVGYVTQEGIITSAYECLEVMSGYFPKYLYYQLHSFDIKKMFYGMGGGLRQNLNYNELKKIRIAVPPFEEQKVIVEYIENRVSSIDTQISSIEKQIANLNEYKQSLISDVVTGKVKV